MEAPSKVEHVAWQIRRLNLLERKRLIELLQEDNGLGPDSGVREPRQPILPPQWLGATVLGDAG